MRPWLKGVGLGEEKFRKRKSRLLVTFLEMTPITFAVILQQTVLPVCPTFRCPDGLCKDLNTKRKGVFEVS